MDGVPCCNTTMMASLDGVEKSRLLKEVPREDFPKLVQILKEYAPSSLCVQGYILQNLRSRALLDCRVYVDVWPGSPQVYIVEILSYRRNLSEENINLLPICGFAVCDKSNLKQFIKSDHFLDRYFSGQNNSEHNGSHFSFLELGQEVPGAAVNIVSYPSICALLEPKNLAKSSEPSGYQLGSLRKKDVPLISKQWHYSNEATVKRLNSLIENSITAGCYKEDDLVSWVFVMEYGGMGVLNTLPTHRNKGLAKSLIYHVSQKLLACGRIPYCFINKGNEVSEKLFSKMGFQYFKQCSAAFFDIKSNVSSSQINKI